MKKLKIWSFVLVAFSMLAISCDKEDDKDDTPTTPAKVGIQGEWQSSGTDVAPLLVGLLGTDSIYANFKTDLSYVVEQFDTSGAKLTFTGVYVQTKSGVGDIYNIELNQSTPSAIVAEGIFEVSGTTMKYEVVQTSPSIGFAPPTASGGFGSTDGGSIGNSNVQTFQEIE